MFGTINQNWLNQNANRAYPICEDCSRLDSTGSFEIPDSLIVDFVLPVHRTATLDPTLFHIKQIIVFADGVSVVLGYDGTSIGAVTATTATHTVNQTYFITCLGDFSDSLAKIVLGRIDQTIEQSTGTFEYTSTTARFETSTIRPDIRGVASLRTLNGESISSLIQDDIVFKAGTNFKLTADDVTNTITFHAISGEGLTPECECEGGATANKPAIKTINGIGPDGAGNFTLTSDNCLEFRPLGNGLVITDKCAAPCCGCDELETVVESQRQVENELATLQAASERLDAYLTALEVAFNSTSIYSPLPPP